MYASDGKVGCTPCREVNNLGVRASPGHSILIYTVCSLHCQKCPPFFCLCCVIRTFLGGSRHYMVKKKCFQFLSIILILYIFLKTLGVFIWINRLCAWGKRSGRANCYICAFSNLRNWHEACSKMSGAHYDVIMLVRKILISSVLVQSLILNQCKVFLAAQGFLSK